MYQKDKNLIQSKATYPTICVWTYTPT